MYVGADASSSVLYVRSNPADTAYRYTPANNGGVNPGSLSFVAYSSSTLINAATGCTTGYAAPDSTCALSGGDIEAKMGGSQAENGLAEVANTYTLYPNPGDGNIMIAQSIAVNTILDVKVMNNAGALVYQGPIEFRNGVANLKINTVAPGVYFVVLADNTGKLNTFRAVIQR